MDFYLCSELKEGKEIAERYGFAYTDSPEIASACGVYLSYDGTGLSLSDGENSIKGDFSRLLPRIKRNNLPSELVVKAAKIKGADKISVLDATAGMGEDAFLLAAAGFDITLCEYDPVIFALLFDTVERAKATEGLSDAASRMTVLHIDSIEYMKKGEISPDVILLDPMFPERQKSSLVKKKFQLIHKLEKPCENGEEMLMAAMSLSPLKIVIKRPVKGEFLGGVKPSHSLYGKAIRYDCIINIRGAK